MKTPFVTSLAALLLTATAFAAAEVKKLKYECSVQNHYQVFDSAGKQIREQAYSARTADGTRVLWEKDGVKYNFSDYNSYSTLLSPSQPPQTRLSAQAKSMTKTVRSEASGLVVYRADRRIVKKYVDDHWDSNLAGKLVDTSSTMEDTYSVVGDQEILVKTVTDGKEEPVWVSSFTKTKMDETSFIQVENFQVPHYEFDAQSKETTVTLKYVLTCHFQEIAP